MNLEMQNAIIEQVSVAWEPIPDTQHASWRSLLATLSYESAVTAIDTMRSVSTVMPAPADFVVACHAEGRAAEERKGRERCSLCDGTGWVYVAQALPGGYESVVRCACSDRPEDSGDHDKGCTCGRCFYGDRQWAKINAGKGIADTDPEFVERIKEGIASVRETVGEVLSGQTPPAGG